MESIKENYAEEKQDGGITGSPRQKQDKGVTGKPRALSSAERQRIYRENNPEKAKQIQKRYRERTSVKNVKLLLDDKDIQIQEAKLELEQIKDLLKKFLKGEIN